MVGCRGDQKMARAEKVVVDASVVVKWYNFEEHTDKALRLRRDYAAHEVDLMAPYLVNYEVANSLRYNPDFGLEDLKAAIGDLLNMQLNLVLLDEPQTRMASELALKHGITFYDAAYLALAETEETTFYTADDKLITKVGGPMVKHIRDYRASK